MNVTRMQLASTLLGVMTACATLGSLEMDTCAQARFWFVFTLLITALVISIQSGGSGTHVVALN